MSVLCFRRATAPIEMAMEELVGITDPDGILSSSLAHHTAWQSAYTKHR
jgi:hypothetical protein